MAEKFKYGLIGSSGRLGEEVKSVFDEYKNQLVFSYSLEGGIRKDIPEVIIDCSLPEVFERSIAYVKEFDSPLIMATTGLSNEQLQILKNISNSVPVVQSYNYSIGIQILLKLVSIAKEKLPDWDVEIEETHHRFKKDKPSGTAKMIQKIFEGKEISTSSLRLGNIPGDHIVHFGGLGEVLSIKHSATSRRTFAEGILKAAEFVLHKKNGFFTFTDVIF
jgi:4-hydroxy-tetrahydrodipicolinate reductase